MYNMVYTCTCMYATHWVGIVPIYIIWGSVQVGHGASLSLENNAVSYPTSRAYTCPSYTCTQCTHIHVHVYQWRRNHGGSGGWRPRKSLGRLLVQCETVA